MTKQQLIAAFGEAVVDTDRSKAVQLIEEAVGEGLSPEEAVFEVVIPVIERQVQSYGTEPEFNLAQHFMIARIATEVTEALLPRFQHTPEVAGCIVIGTAHGDLHTLGKRIVIGCLKTRMIEAIDLGVNVSAERFVDEALARQAQVIGISAMMVHTACGAKGCLKVRQILKERGLEDRVKIIVGGAPFRFDPRLCQAVHADAWAEDGVAAGRTILELIQEARQ